MTFQLIPQGFVFHPDWNAGTAQMVGTEPALSFVAVLGGAADLGRLGGNVVSFKGAAFLFLVRGESAKNWPSPSEKSRGNSVLPVSLSS